MPDAHIEPVYVIRLVEGFVTKAFEDEAKYDNVTLLNESQVWDLHRMVASVYSQAYGDGRLAAEEQHQARRQRELDAARRAEASND